MRRIKNVYSQICSEENIFAAEKKARKGKTHQYGVKIFDKDATHNLFSLRRSLLDKTFRTSDYTRFTIFEPKEREISRLPYFPDRIVHHAIMNILEPIFTSVFTADTYSCIKGRGIHGALNAVRKALRDEVGTKYCLQIDIKKFYPSINHEILKGLLYKKFKDGDLVSLLFGIVDSSLGVPIGNYLSQYFANFYMTPFDYWVKQDKKVKYYFRYADDMVFLSNDKEELHKLLADIKIYLAEKLKLQVKENYQVFPVASRGINFVGYICYHTHTRIRPSIKRRMARMIRRRKNRASIGAYKGWMDHCDSRHLMKKLLS